MSEKKMVSRNVAIALGIVCIGLISGIVIEGILLLNNVSELTQKYDALGNSWEGVIPDNLNGLFQNKVVLWNDKKLTEPSNTEANETLVYDFNQTGCLFVNITSSTSELTWVRTEWSYEIYNSQGWHNVTVRYSIDAREGGLVPVLNGVTHLQIYSGATNLSETRNENQTVTIVYYY